MILTYLILTAIVVLIVILLNLPPSCSKRTAYDELEDNPTFKALQELHQLQQKLASSKTVDSKIPEGYGEFGLEVTNPIPINTVIAETSYLGKLRTEDGVKVEYRRYGSAHAPNINHPIDRYEIKANGEYICDIFLCPYYDITSDIAPKGFKLHTWWKNEEPTSRNHTEGLSKKEKIGLFIIEFSMLLLLNLIIIGIGTVIMRMFDLFHFLTISFTNALWMYLILLQLIKKYWW